MKGSPVGLLLCAVATGSLACGGETDHSSCAETDTTAGAMTTKCQAPLAILRHAGSDEPYLPCRLYEAFRAGSPQCACDAPGYASVDSVPSSVTEEIRVRSETCEDGCCSDTCLCELRQLDGPELQACLYEPFASSPTGWCYVDVRQGVGVPGFESKIAGCGHGFRIRSYEGKFEGYLACQY
jgi:hypothetical protein